MYSKILLLFFYYVMCLSLYLSACLSLYLLFYLLITLSVALSIIPLTYHSIILPVCYSRYTLPANLSLCIISVIHCFYISFYLSVSLSAMPRQSFYLNQLNFSSNYYLHQLNWISIFSVCTFCLSSCRSATLYITVLLCLQIFFPMYRSTCFSIAPLSNYCVALSVSLLTTVLSITLPVPET